MNPEMKELLQAVLQETMAPLINELHILNRRMGHLESTMATKEELKDIRQSMATKEELQVIRQSMATKEDVADLPFIKQAIIELSEKVNHLAHRQERQEKVIELLAARSLRHEAELSELRQLIQS